jgi:catechol 2,3-dioxygenase-like lactoylglutathione lyase family enzyme
VLGWDVSDLDATVRAMRRAGVEFEIFPGLNDDNELSIWIAPGGSRIAWFRDPDGNMLSVSQMTA